MNELLSLLPPEVCSLLDRHLERVELKTGDVLYRAGSPIEYIYFPDNGLVSIVVTMESGETAETSIVGREGMVCSAIVLDVNDAIEQATAELPGHARRISSKAFINLYSQNEKLRSLVNRYHALMFAEARQSVACNSLHQAPERLCRWLSNARDRTGQDTLPLTQEFLARMLGVNRSTITSLYPLLEKGGLIRGTRGHVEILDLDGLRASACECYGVLRKRSEQIFPEYASAEHDRRHAAQHKRG